MVTRRQLKRLKEAARQGAVVVQTRDGTVEAFSEMAPLALFSLQMAEERALYKGTPVEERPPGVLKYQTAALHRSNIPTLHYSNTPTPHSSSLSPHLPYLSDFPDFL